MACNGAAAIRVWEGMAAQVRQVDTHCPTQPWNHTTILHFRNPLPACPQGRKKNASASGVTVAGVAGAAAAAQLAEKAKKDHTHADFYRFQQREKRRNGERCGGGVEGLEAVQRLRAGIGAGLDRQLHAGAPASLDWAMCSWEVTAGVFSGIYLGACRAAGPAGAVRGGQEAACGPAQRAQVEAVLSDRKCWIVTMTHTHCERGTYRK